MRPRTNGVYRPAFRPGLFAVAAVTGDIAGYFAEKTTGVKEYGDVGGFPEEMLLDEEFRDREIGKLKGFWGKGYYSVHFD